jgi:hypothetical protein
MNFMMKLKEKSVLEMLFFRSKSVIVSSTLIAKDQDVQKTIICHLFFVGVICDLVR